MSHNPFYTIENPELIGYEYAWVSYFKDNNIPKNIIDAYDAIGNKEVMGQEIMAPVVVLKSYDTFEDAVDMAVRNMLEAGGVGHIAGLFSNNQEHIRYAGEKIPVARLLINQPTPDAWGPATNSLSPAVSESCGTWGNNILAENVDYIHLINVSRIVMPLDVKAPTAKEIFSR